MNLLEALLGEQVDPLRSAILLAMTETMEAERLMKEYCSSNGQKCAVTMLGGNSAAVRDKIVGAVIGACLNNGLIEKSTENIHPVIHALHEAARGAKLDAALSQNFHLKIAIVRQNKHIAVTLFGRMGFSELSDHLTIGSGIHVIP